MSDPAYKLPLDNYCQKDETGQKWIPKVGYTFDGEVHTTDVRFDVSELIYVSDTKCKDGPTVYEIDPETGKRLYYCSKDVAHYQYNDPEFGDIAVTIHQPDGSTKRKERDPGRWFASAHKYLVERNEELSTAKAKPGRGPAKPTPIVTIKYPETFKFIKKGENRVLVEFKDNDGKYVQAIVNPFSGLNDQDDGYIRTTDNIDKWPDKFHKASPDEIEKYAKMANPFAHEMRLISKNIPNEMENFYVHKEILHEEPPRSLSSSFDDYVSTDNKTSFTFRFPHENGFENTLHEVEVSKENKNENIEVTLNTGPYAGARLFLDTERYPKLAEAFNHGSMYAMDVQKQENLLAAKKKNEEDEHPIKN